MTQRTPLGRRLAGLRGDYETSSSAISDASGISMSLLAATETGDRVADTRAVGAILAVADLSILDLERLAVAWAEAAVSGQRCLFALCSDDGAEFPAAFAALASSRLSAEAPVIVEEKPVEAKEPARFFSDDDEELQEVAPAEVAIAPVVAEKAKRQVLPVFLRNRVAA